MESNQYDIAIIGGGILGLSTAMQLMERAPNWRVAVIEKEAQLAMHQTGHNSGVMHSGIYYRPGSHKAQFCVAGLNNMVKFCDENEIEYQQCGKVIVALNESELGRLQDLFERGTANGVPDLEIVGPERLKEIEPHTVGMRALWAPHTGIVDFTKVAAAFANKFQQAGGDIFTGAAVKKVTNMTGSVALETTKGTLQAKHLINCAGLYADKVATMTGEKLGVKIMILIGMLAWVARYALFAVGAPDQVVWMIMLGVVLHGICYDFFFVTGFMYTDKRAPKEVRSQAQALLVFFTQGVGMFFGYKIAGAKFEAVKESSNALAAAIETPVFGFWESFGKMLLTEKPSVDGSLIQDAMVNWETFWMFPCMMALAVAGLFAVAFWDKVKQEDAPAGQSE